MAGCQRLCRRGCAVDKEMQHVLFYFFFKTNPEVAQVIIAHKKEMTPQNAAARRKQASGGMAGSFRQFGVSHAQRWERKAKLLNVRK